MANVKRNLIRRETSRPSSFSNKSCLICHRRLNLQSSTPQLDKMDKMDKNVSVEILKKLANVLQVSLSIYQEVDFDEVPVPLLCAECNETIVDGIQLQEAMRTLQNQLKKLTRSIKRDIIRSFHVDTQNGGGNDECVQVELIRKIYAQCWGTCEVKIPACRIPLSVGDWDSSRDDTGVGDEFDSAPASPMYLSDGEGDEVDEDSDLDYNPDKVKPERMESIGIWEEESGMRDSSGFAVKDESTRSLSTVNRISGTNSGKRANRPPAPAQCQNCGRMFTRLGSLKDHLQRKKACSKEKFYAYRKGQEIIAFPERVVDPANFNPQLEALSSSEAFFQSGSGEQATPGNPVLFLMVPPVTSTTMMTPLALSSNSQRLDDSTPEQNEGNCSSETTESLNVAAYGPSLRNPRTARCASSSKSSPIRRSVPQVKNPPEKTIPLKPVKCKRCGKLFTTLVSLKNHRRKKNPCINVYLKTERDTARINNDTDHSHSGSTLLERKSELSHATEHLDQESVGIEGSDHHPGIGLAPANHFLMEFRTDPSPGLSTFPTVVPPQDVASEVSVQTSEARPVPFPISNQDPNTNPLPPDKISGEGDSSKPKFLQCPTCHMKFTMETHLQSHIRMNHTEIQCKSCGEVFPSYRTLMQHRREVHGYVNINKRVREAVHKCDLCGKSYTKNTNLRAHILQKHHGVQKVLPCQSCNQTFPTRHLLNKHIELQHGEVQHLECKLCGETMFAEKLPPHLALHNGHSDFPCPVCNARLPTERAFTFHQNKFHGPPSNNPKNPDLAPPQFQCKLCGDTMVQDRLPKHLELHDGYPDFPCKLCSLRFPSEHAIKIHLTRYHAQGSSNSSSNNLNLTSV